VLAGLRPLLMQSRPDDPEQKVGFLDEKWLKLPGGGGAAEIGERAVYLAISLRNVGTGIAVLHGWRLHTERLVGRENHPPGDLTEFTRLSRDLYIPFGDTGFWQGTFRDPERPDHIAAKEAVEARTHLTVDLLYGDYEGGQRIVTRFLMTPRAETGWIVSVVRHWNIDNPDPR
jgi:hypothetical protein